MSQRTWLITGCSSGFGELLVHRILSRGDRVIATARKLESIKHFEQAGAATLHLDVTEDEATINEILTKAIAIYGTVDVLVNNAGFVTQGAWEDLDHDRFLAQFETNVFGTIKVTRALLPHFRKRRSGTVVFVGSLSGWVGHPFVGAYAGSKFALEGLVEGLSKETKHLGIKTLLIEPGRFRTKLLSTGNLKLAPSKIPDYTEMSKGFISTLTGEDMAQLGDPQKAVEIILDLVHEEGCAKGKKLPTRLPLGVDCYDEVKAKCEETLKLLEEWKSVIRSTDF